MEIIFTPLLHSTWLFEENITFRYVKFVADLSFFFFLFINRKKASKKIVFFFKKFKCRCLMATLNVVVAAETNKLELSY